MHILLTGGGTGGHIQPNLALVSATARFKKLGRKVRFSYMGSIHGPEANLAREHHIPFVAIQTGKLRRYFSLQNLSDGLRVLMGIKQAIQALKKMRPDAVFATGGFVSGPVLWAAHWLKIPTLLYDLDATPNLTTRWFAPRATRVLTSFQESAEALKKKGIAAETIGPLLRPEMMEGSREKALKWSGFSGQKPILLVMGGSQGAQELNEKVLSMRSELEQIWDVIHLLGEGKGEALKTDHYFSLESVGESMRDIYAMTTIALTRGGANSLAELEAWKIPSLVWPLGLNTSRGDQWANAKALTRRGAPFRILQNSEHVKQELEALNRHASHRPEVKKDVLEPARRILEILDSFTPNSQ